MEILSDRPLWVICQSGRSLALAHRVVLEIAMAIIGGAGSAAMIMHMYRLLTGKYSQQGLFSGPQGFVGAWCAGIGPCRSVPMAALGN